jgi:hypothetical protein
MTHRRETDATEQSSTSEGDVLRPVHRDEKNEESRESITLGVGSRFRLVDTEHEPVTLVQLRGLLPVPPEVEAEVKRQEVKYPMTPDYRKALRDRLTLEHYFADVEVAFRRTPEGIEVLAAGLDEIDRFRRTSTAQERQGIVYGVG